MPSSYPIPSIAALALSLYASDRKVENLPVVREYLPRETVKLTVTDRGMIPGFHSLPYEGI